MSILWLCRVIVAIMVVMVPRGCSGHGYLLEPPSRSSLWRVGYNTPHNYDDNALNCGGEQVLWYVNKGKCGVCGDEWSLPTPRPNEDGGLYGLGIITRTYSPGQDIDVSVEITANHGGWFEFRLCPRESNNTVLTHECLDQHLLQIVNDGNRYKLGTQYGIVQLKIRLPAGVTCSHCVIQWKYRGDVNTGGDAVSQQEFYSCSDVAIGGSGVSTQPPTGTVPLSTIHVGLTSLPAIVTTPTPATTTAPHAPTTSFPVYTGSSECHAAGLVAGHSDFDQWCRDNCRRDRPCTFMYCDPACNSATGPVSGRITETLQRRTSANSNDVSNPNVQVVTTRGPSTGSLNCSVTGRWTDHPDFVEYCYEVCAVTQCDPNFCICSSSG